MVASLMRMVFPAAAVLLFAALAQEFDGVVRPTGDGRYEAYMIPPNISNHASFLELLPSGELLMAWFSGTDEGANNCSIVVARLPASSIQWSTAAVVSWRVGYSNQNPVLFMDSSSKDLYLFHSQQPASGEDSTEDRAHIWMLESTDGRGLEWTSPVILFDKNGSYDRNRIILSLNGAWIYPIYYSVDGIVNQYSVMEISGDHKTWTEFAVRDSNYLIQPSVVRPKAGQSYLLSYFRDKRKGNIYISTSVDEGKTWSTPAATELPNNDAAIQATVLQDGKLAIVFNPTHEDRYPIRIALSEDGGKTWPHYKDLDTGPSGSEFSYPSILQSPNGYIHVSYTYNRKTIKYVKFMEEWIMN